MLAGLILATGIAGVIVHLTVGSNGGFTLIGIAAVAAVILIAVTPAGQRRRR
jgi:hypothetical protein